METLQELSAAVLSRYPNDRAIEFNGAWHSWGELKTVGDAVARLIAEGGVGEDGPICLISRNHPATYATLLGLIARGRNLRMVYPFQAAAGIVRDIKRLEPAAFVMTSADMADEIGDALAKDGVVGIVLDGMEARTLPGLEKVGPVAAQRSFTGEPQINILTSGTTGPPKTFSLTFDMIRKHHLGAVDTSPEATRSAQDGLPALLYMPLGNISGIFSSLPVLLRGIPARLLDRFSMQAWVDYVKEFRPVRQGVPPSMMQQLIDMDVPKEDLVSLKSMGSGAAPLDPKVQAEFEDKYGIPVLVSYGATEFGGPVVDMPLELHPRFGRTKLGTVGVPKAGCDIRVVDPDDGHILGVNEVGALEVLAPRIQPDWIRTSDVGRIDEDGFLFLSGRADGAIMRGGFKVLPETIEKALLIHPAIAEAAVVAVPDERVGQVPGAAIRLRADQPVPSSEELVAHLRQHTLSTHIPVHWRVVEQLPRNPSMKIDRPAVKRLFAEANQG